MSFASAVERHGPGPTMPPRPIADDKDGILIPILRLYFLATMPL